MPDDFMKNVQNVFSNDVFNRFARKLNVTLCCAKL